MKAAVILAVLVYAAEASFLMEKYGLMRRSEESCQQLLEQCAAPLEEYEDFFADPATVARTMNSTVIDGFCRDLQGFASCARGLQDACNIEIGTEMDVMEDIVQYLCSDTGRQLLVQMARSRCSRDEQYAHRLEESFNLCYQNFEMEIMMFMFRAMEAPVADPAAEVCPLLDQFKVCTIRDTRRLCGRAYGQFVEAIWDIAMTQQMAAENIQCGEQARSVRHMVARAVTFIRKPSPF